MSGMPTSLLMGVKMKKTTMMAAASALAIVIAFAAPTAANAVGKSGTTTCGPSAPHSWVRSYATGYVTQRAPGGSIFSHVNATAWKVRVNQGINGGGAWYANTDGAMDSAGTYAYCTNYS